MDIVVQAAEILFRSTRTSIMVQYVEILFVQTMVGMMTIVEALKKNKPLRRPISKHMGKTGDGYMDPVYVYHLLICGQIPSMRYLDYIPATIRPVRINKVDLLADDWMVKE